MKDVEIRYRHRYVGFNRESEVKETFVKRSKVIKSVREILDGRILEVETPILNTIPGGAAARPFITYHNALDMQIIFAYCYRVEFKTTCGRWFGTGL